MFKSRFVVLIIFVLFGMWGCLEYKDQMKINSDGSGELTFSIGMSESMMNMTGESEMKEFSEDSIKQSFSNAKGITYLGSKSYSENGVRWLETRLKFDSPEHLKIASENNKQNGLIGDISLVDEGDKMVFTRKVYSSEKNNDSTDNFGSGMAAMMFGNVKWKYIVVFPGEIIEANTSEENIDRKNNSVTWTFPMSEIITKSQTMHASILRTGSKPVDMIVILGMICAVLVVIFYVYDKRKRASAAKS